MSDPAGGPPPLPPSKEAAEWDAKYEEVKLFFVYKPKPDGAATTVAGVEKAKPGVEMEDADNVRARQAQAQRDQRDRPKFLPSSKL